MLPSFYPIDDVPIGNWANVSGNAGDGGWRVGSLFPDLGKRRGGTAAVQIPVPTSSFRLPTCLFRFADLSFPPENRRARNHRRGQNRACGRLLFDFDKADIRSDVAATHTQAAKLIRQKSKGPVRVEGHSDSRGGDAYYPKLSERCAQRWLAGSATAEV
jgi:outer membrane protein OmpA-like peptidoglycan-associated protein